jgi:rSAM/selenodomain-associated transferase 1
MPTRANALAIMAKAPVAGSVKTRLVPPLTAEQAAELYRALLLDQFEHLRQLVGAERYVFYAPADAEQLLCNLAGADYAYRAQSEGDLGARMEHVFAELRRIGHRNIVLIGSDLPALPLALVGEAFRRLATAENRVVLGPSQDGGYYLIGMNQATPEVFANMTWSHDRVLADTTARLDRLGLAYSLLPTWFDLDVAEDFQRLAALAEPASHAALRRTRSCLQGFGLWPVSKV